MGQVTLFIVIANVKAVSVAKKQVFSTIAY
jgi:hypothetical protein